MSNSNNCFVTIGSIESNSSRAVKKIQNIIKNNSILNQLDVITFEQNRLKLDCSKFNYYEVSNFETLTDLLSNIYKVQTDGAITIEAIPSNQVLSDPRLDIVNTFKFNSASNDIILKLVQTTYQSLPNLSNIGIVQKLRSTKKGHGSKNFVSYNYSIKIKLNNHTDIPPELIHVIGKVFNDCSLKVSTFNHPNMSFFKDSDSIKIDKKLLNMNLNTRLLFGKITYQDQEQLNEFYEYLVLLHLNSPQLLEDSDNFISVYRVPEFELLEDKSSSLNQHSIKNVNSLILNDLLNQPWLSVSCRSNESHILLFKNPIDNQLIVWECK